LGSFRQNQNRRLLPGTANLRNGVAVVEELIILSEILSQPIEFTVLHEHGQQHAASYPIANGPYLPEGERIVVLLTARNPIFKAAILSG
jgi:hypothetical protein